MNEDSDLIDIASHLLHKNKEDIESGVTDILKKLVLEGNASWPDSVPQENAKIASMAILMHLALTILGLSPGQDEKSFNPNERDLATARQIVELIGGKEEISNGFLVAMLDILSEEIVKKGRSV